MRRPMKATSICVTANGSRAGWILGELHAVHAPCKVLTWPNQVLD